MFLREFKNPVSGIRGVTPARAEKLATLGIITVADLLLYYPKDYENRAAACPLKDYQRQRNVCTVVKVLDHQPFMFKGSQKWRIIIEDETARAVILAFSDFLSKKLRIGSSYRLSGHFEKNRYGELVSTKVDCEEASINNEDSTRFKGILPVYFYSRHDRNQLLRAVIKTALATSIRYIEDELPAYLIRRDGLFPKARALRALHFPESMEEAATAKRTLIYEELFYLEAMVGLRSLKRKQGRLGSASVQTSRPNPPLTALQQRLVERLPFRLTRGQLDAVDAINQDMDSAYPMARLLQGDVGSGKTLVAFMAALYAIDSKAQAALMAPTELLARQHAETAARLLEPLGVRVAFLTGTIKAGGRKELLKALAQGDIDIVAGTHALFSRDVAYHKLSLVIIDEQHRFGVTQRQTIMSKGDSCHLLMMSATPIPRTLAMTVFGDMDVSVMKDMPPGRKPVITHLAADTNEQKVYEFVRRELQSGRQAYFVYPLIELSEELTLKDAQSMYERLSTQIFPQSTCALLHSRVDEEEKRLVMERFRANKIQILVATSVVEVGVDVPNATCMVIEHAERFGLSALHQLRGRVGRGDHQSYCFLIYARQYVPAKYHNTAPEMLSDEERSKEGRRLMVMLKNTDGFAIAEEDLKFRGPGQITGTEQSGFMPLNLADPIRDTEVLEHARSDIFSILEQDPGLFKDEHLVINEVLRRAPPFGATSI